ncbi:uncharacterized protein N7515_000983 [Penicillium bovifimosum]|uniref:HypA n=1 Tax=Penicillium bovifimosum TaxID=126998 RepID=A0A9W9HH39_9EURO|nr:uncharacterized protein N7515_000983 [Penicillium bovifimosum]KAJ5146419.1 hypothetical protein N7515_000983 [Penicillium bovifimosum]
MLPRLLQHHKRHLFAFNSTARNRLRIFLTNDTRYYSALPSLLQTATQPSTFSPRLPFPQLVAPYSSYSLNNSHGPRVTPSKMATATTINLSLVTDSGVFSSGVREDAARTASEILQEDMAKHHVFFNEHGFHNHIPHQVLTIFALGAAPADIKACYDRNAIYQRPVMPTDQEVVKSMHDVTKFQEYFGKEQHYPNYLAFFQQELDAKGVGSVLTEYVFAGDQRAESMLCRLFGGLIHPLIHLGFGLEFNQPAIVAQALAQAAVHEEWIGREFFLPTEKMAGGIGKSGQKSLLQLLNEIRTDKALVESVQWGDANKIRDGVLHRAPEQMMKYAAQFTVSEDQVPERLADMINTVVYYTAAAQRPTKKMRLDFFYIHCVNSSIFFSKIVNLPFLDQRAKLRLLEWKGRMDLLMYTSRGSPNLLLDEIASYPIKEDWSQIFTRSITHPDDDGHLAKLARALANGEKVCKPFEDQNSEMPIKGDMWLRIGNMAIDCTDKEETGSMWIRSTGFDEAWEPQAQAHM